MPDYSIDIPPERLIAWITRDSREDQERYHLNVARVFEGPEAASPTALGTLDVEPRITRNYWILRIAVRKPASVARDPDAPPGETLDLRIEDFEREFLPADPERTRVTLMAETDEARRHFDTWLDEMRAKFGGGA